MLDLTGSKFGKLLAICPDGQDKNKRYYWKCLCECGNEVRIKSNNLKSGNSKSCGCDKRALDKHVKDLTGMIFGELTVLKRDYSRLEKGRVYWICACSCGETVSVWMAHLLNKHNVKCSIKGRHAESDSHKRTIWSDEVKKMFNETCQKCGAKENLNAHHIISFTSHIEGRFDVNNGSCLCEKCHKDFHREYGVMKNTTEDFDNWLNIDSMKEAD